MAQIQWESRSISLVALGNHAGSWLSATMRELLDHAACDREQFERSCVQNYKGTSVDAGKPGKQVRIALQ